MTDKPRLQTPLLRVVLDDGATFEVQTRNADLVAWDRERTLRKWPTAQDTPFVWLTYLAWKALVREGAVPADIKFDAFTERTLEVSSVQDEDGSTEADPTQTAATPRLLVALAIATHTMPSWWEQEPDEAIVTAVEILNEQAERMSRGR